MISRWLAKNDASRKAALANHDLLETLYRQRVDAGLLEFDPAQLNAVQHLQERVEDLLRYVRYSQKPILQRLGKAPVCLNVYIYGDVGRGKSMLMDLFFTACPVTQKRRVHFHAFMLEVHAFNFSCREQGITDAIPVLARKLRQSLVLLCFDEFNVTDIADAMILQRLFGELWAVGVVIVMTSNRHPNQVYRGGLLQEQFQQFTNMLLDSSELIELTGRDDYRLSKAPGDEIGYFYPLGEQAGYYARQRYQHYTHDAPVHSVSLDVLGRKLVLSAAHNDVAMASFAELCEQPLGAADYLMLAERFKILILVEIPRLTSEHRNQAKRFVTLIDALYEKRVKLICTAAVKAQDLYTEGDGAFEFARTVSRLMEMQSQAYQLAEITAFESG